MKILNKWIDETIVFFKDHIFLCVGVFLMMFMEHGKHAFTTNSLYDTDDVIFNRGSTLNWLEIGRQGNVLTKKVFGLLWYNPYFAGALSLILFPVTVVLICRLFHMAGLRKNRQDFWIFALVFMACPVWVYQFYFSVQWFEIVWAMFLLVVTAALFQLMFAERGWYTAIRKYKQALLFLVEVLLLVWAFSSYQSFVPMFIALCASLYLIALSSDACSFDAAEYLRRLGWMTGVFITAFLLNTVITNRFFTNSDYLMGQTVWGEWDLGYILYHLAAYFLKSHTGMGIQYSWMMGVGTCCLMLLALKEIRRKETNRLYKALYIASAVVVWLAAHMLTLYAGAVTAIRSQLVYPFTMAFLLMFVADQITDKGRKNEHMQLWRGLRSILILLIIVGVWGQLGNTFRLNYTEDMKDKMDMAVAYRVIEQVNQLGYGAEPEQPVVFVGNYSPKINRACIDTIQDASIGVSCWERVNEQPNRLVRMIENQFGVSYVRSDWNTTERAREISRDMPMYPQEGYVQEREAIIIVKMSDDY